MRFSLGGLVALAIIAGTLLVAGPGGHGFAAGGERLPGTVLVLREGPGEAGTYIPPQPPPSAPGVAPQAAGATVVVNYTGFTPEAQAAFQYAVDIWKARLTSPVTIVVDATWEPLTTGTLGSAKAASLRRNFTNAPRTNTWYPIALANKFAGTDIDDTESDIEASFNSTKSNWYFGTDGNTPVGTHDLVTVVLHELGHGLGFSDSMVMIGTIGRWQNGNVTTTPVAPKVYDLLLYNGSGQQLVTSFGTGTTALGSQLTSDNLFLDGPKIRAANGGAPAKVYAPTYFEEGSSIGHLDETAFPAGDPNSLMTPMLDRAEAIHDPGAIAMAALEETGWSVPEPPPTPHPVYANRGLAPLAAKDTSGGPAPATPTIPGAPTATATKTATKTPTPPSTLPPGGAVTLQHVAWWTNSLGSIYVHGEAVNGLGHPISFVKVTASYWNAANQLLGTEYGYAGLTTIPGGADSVFTILKTNPWAGIHHVTVGVTSYTDPASASYPPVTGLVANVTNQYTDSIGWLHLVGTVTNTSGNTYKWVQPYAGFYNSAGDVVRAFFDYTDPTTLAPGQSGTFDISVSASGTGIVSYRIWVDGDWP
ncbi:MAG: hypothetical protein HY875_06000 [Chloroflexi bacterium]|nr:hypothetical protein [Chloroflexota bacterium]